jgi:hypothetical protein
MKDFGSPAFSDFRYWMDLWDHSQQDMDRYSKVEALLDGQQFILFFKKGDTLYGSTEESRLIFAKLKNPDEDACPEWRKEANFLAIDLAEALKGNRVQHVFNAKDIKKIKILPRENMEKLLVKRMSTKKALKAKEPEHGRGVGEISVDEE